MITKVISWYFLIVCLVSLNHAPVWAQRTDASKNLFYINQTIDDSQLFAFTRIYHTTRVLAHLQHYGANRFASPVRLSPQEFSEPGIQHLVAIVDLRTSPAIITLPQQFTPFRSIQVLDLNYRQLYYQQVTKGEHKFVLADSRSTGRRPEGKQISTNSALVMVILRTLSGYPNAYYSKRNVRGKINVSGFSENIATPAATAVTHGFKAEDVIRWMLDYQTFSPLQTMWLQLELEKYNVEVSKKIQDALNVAYVQTRLWHNRGLMNAPTDAEQGSLGQQALGLLFSYPSIAATDRLEVIERLDMDMMPATDTPVHLVFDPDNISAGLWSIDSIPHVNEHRTLNNSHHSFNTNRDHLGNVRIKLQVEDTNALQTFKTTDEHSIVLDSKHPFIRRFYYRPDFSLLRDSTANPQLFTELIVDER